MRRIRFEALCRHRPNFSGQVELGPPRSRHFVLAGSGKEQEALQRTERVIERFTCLPQSLQLSVIQGALPGLLGAN